MSLALSDQGRCSWSPWAWPWVITAWGLDCLPHLRVGPGCLGHCPRHGPVRTGMSVDGPGGGCWGCSRAGGWGGRRKKKSLGCSIGPQLVAGLTLPLPGPEQGVGAGWGGLSTLAERETHQECQAGAGSQRHRLESLPRPHCPPLGPLLQLSLHTYLHLPDCPSVCLSHSPPPAFPCFHLAIPLSVCLPTVNPTRPLTSLSACRSVCLTSSPWLFLPVCLSLSFLNCLTSPVCVFVSPSLSVLLCPACLFFLPSHCLSGSPRGSVSLCLLVCFSLPLTLSLDLPGGPRLWREGAISPHPLRS